MSISSIKSTLLTKMQGLSTVAVVSGFNVAPWPQYPGASLTALEGSAQFASTHHNNRERAFSLKVYVDHTVWSRKQAEDLSIDVLDEVETALDWDTTLSGTVALVTPVSWSTRFETREFDQKILNLTIATSEIVVVRSSS